MKSARRKTSGQRALMLLGAAGLIALVLAIGVQARDNYVEVPGKVRVIELAICLDASGSMSGLIDAAKEKLWAVVNDLALAQPTPDLRVALFTYGNDGHEPQDGWVALQTPFTDDLDLVSERLFAVTTNGGTEYVGRVLQAAGGLQWSPSSKAMQLIVVAGNESADQDTLVSFRTMCSDLIGRGIVVHSIYCGPADDGIAPGWREVAQLADGKFASIDHNNGTIAVATPFDDQLGVLSSELNLTYLPFGASGRAGAANQAAQDVNAKGMNSAAEASRAMAKSTALYSCAWDLVDACRAGDIKIAEVKEEDLPEAMQQLNVTEREKYIEEMDAKRQGIKNQITEVSTKRDVFVRDEMNRRSLDDSKAFDSALRKAIREQAVARGFSFKGQASLIDVDVRESRKLQSANIMYTSQVSVNSSAAPVIVPISVNESAAVKRVFARAMSIRPGIAKSDSREKTTKVRLVPDLVVQLGSPDDWPLLQKLLKPERWEQLPSPNEMLLYLDDQTVLVINNGC